MMAVISHKKQLKVVILICIQSCCNLAVHKTILFNMINFIRAYSVASLTSLYLYQINDKQAFHISKIIFLIFINISTMSNCMSSSNSKNGNDLLYVGTFNISKIYQDVSNLQQQIKEKSSKTFQVLCTRVVSGAFGSKHAFAIESRMSRSP